jgi:hypothetical protein
MGLTAGRLLYLGYHQPLAWLARSRREGGPWQQWIDARGRAAMREAAARLPAQPAAAAGAPRVAFLTGKKFWYQTALCCWTLRHHAGLALQPVFVDDGTLDTSLLGEIERVFPGALVEKQDDIDVRLDTHLPEKKFPTLRNQRRTYIHLRKLTDVHVGRRGWQLVLDSDMLFFRRPAELIHWLSDPLQPVHMLDVHDSYGYPDSTLTELAAPHPLPKLLNVGILGLRSETIDWEQLEAWCAALLRRHGTSYYLEQALVALWLSRSHPVRLAREDYRVMPDEDECRVPQAVMHHYVADSKRGYFRHAWQRALARGST